MSGLISGLRRPLRTFADRWALPADLLLLLALLGGATLLIAQLDGGPAIVTKAVGVLTFAAGVAAAILLAAASWLAGSSRARWLAVAVGLYTGGARLLRTSIAEHPLSTWVVASGVAVLGAGGLFLVIAGARAGAGLPRRIGLAFVTLAVAHAVPIVPGGPSGGGRAGTVLGLAAIAVLLVAAVLFFGSALRGVWHRQEVTSSRLAMAEARIASVAERDHEMRNLVAGLSGAASVLAGTGVDSPTEGRRLLAAAGAEIERLRRMLDPQAEPVATSMPGTARDPSVAAVDPLLRGLVAVHRAGGADIRIVVENDPHVAIAAGELAQVITNLLTNCARHAPGAPVWVRAAARGDQVRIEVADAGPGLPADLRGAVLRRGVRRAGSPGSGLGLSIVDELVGRCGGTFRLVSAAGSGCRAVIDLPAARRPAEEVST